MTDPRIITSRIDLGGFTIWQAWDDRLGADTSPIGDGPTEADAIDDLLWQMNDKEKSA